MNYKQLQTLVQVIEENRPPTREEAEANGTPVGLSDGTHNGSFQNPVVSSGETGHGLTPFAWNFTYRKQLVVLLDSDGDVIHSYTESRG